MSVCARRAEADEVSVSFSEPVPFAKVVPPNAHCDWVSVNSDGVSHWRNEMRRPGDGTDASTS